MIRPKWDWWQFLLLVGAPIAAIVVILIGRDVPIAARVVITLVFATLLWLVLSTRYEVTGDALVVVFGPFRLTYLWAEMKRVRKGGWWAQVSSFREPRMRMAFSVDNLIVECEEGKRTRRVVISPADKTSFLRLVREHAPQAVMEGL